MRRSLSSAASAVQGRLVGADKNYDAVSTDTRTLKPGALFVALRGPKFDANEFVAAAAAAGAVGAIVDRPLPATAAQTAAQLPAQTPSALALIIVPDTLAALQRLAACWRREFGIPIVAVAGSNGKTTTKEMTAAILAKRGPCLATQGNLNNHIGVPLTLLRLDAAQRSAVVEIGADRVGEVAALMPLVRPTVGLITNAGAEHLEFFGDLDGVAKGEGEAVAGLDADATAVINADDAYADYWRGLAGARSTISFGLRESADFSAQNVSAGIEQGEFMTRFSLVCPLGEAPVTLRAGGVHNIANALCAAAAASAAGAAITDIVEGLKGFRAVKGRLQFKPGKRGSWIIDDSYNANPNSVRAGLDVLRSLGGAKWLVFGDMGELGAHSEASHTDAGRYARECGVERLFALGSLTPRTVASFGAGAEWFEDADALVRRLGAELRLGVTVLVKGSRVNRLERVVQALTEPVESDAAPNSPTMAS
jgi:UDP-N-acetylmuramoyl-tripeptide--D-alanyl-D-alanine ligase